jgi:Uma2 family endonuclease
MPVNVRTNADVQARLPLLENGDRLTQREFHRRYEAYPENVKIELIGGVVYVSSPARRPHGRYSSLLGGVLNQYEAETPGVEALENFTTLLDDENEPQPDKGLRISDEYGGQSRVNESQYIVGAPELLAEIAHSSVTIDLSDKKDNYQRGGVCEYIVVCVEEEEVIWFDFKRNCRLRPDRDGIIRSRVFPGLWLDVPALFAESAKRLAQTLNKGLASPAHGKFVEKMRRKCKPES